MTTKYIHVNQHVIKSNIKHKKLDPTISIKEDGNNIYCNEVEILGPSKVVYSKDGLPILDCGARVVIITESDLRIIR